MLSREVEKIFLWIIKIGLWLIPFLPLYVSYTMLFPFITGKNFAFRIIVEIIFALWAGIAFAKPEYRPRLSPLLKAATVFIVILFLADLFSPNPYRAFFSNYERMEGFMMIFHLYLYFLMLLGVFKTRRDWLIFFHSTLAASFLVSIIALLQKFGLRVSLQGGFRVDSTIGNPAYLAAYLIFHVWLAIYLLYQFWRNWWLRAVYVILFLFYALIIYFTATRGAILALIASSFIFAASIIWLWPKIFPNTKRLARKISAVVLAIFILVPLLLFVLRNSNFVVSNTVLQRLTSISLSDKTTQARFAIWGTSFKGVLDRPILGWGQENYYLIFQKYFNPKLYSSEPWFDRSHNIIFDWLVHAGLLGLLSYLAMIGSALWMIWRSLKISADRILPGLILVSVFLTHFLQNIFVFDNLNTYLLFFSFLAYSDFWSFQSGNTAIEETQKKSRTSRQNSARFIIGFLAILILVFGSGYFLHIKPILEAKILIQSLQLHQAKAPMDVLIGSFKKALSYNTFGDTEVREQLASIARGIPGNTIYTPEEQKQFVEFSIAELKKESSIPAKDVKHIIFLASVLDRSASLNPAYLQEAEVTVLEALRISPTKQMMYYELAQIYVMAGQFDKAIKTLEEASLLEPKDYQPIINIIIVAAASQKLDVVKETSLKLNWKIIDQEALLRLGTVYLNLRDYNNAKKVYETLVYDFPKKAEYHSKLSAILAELNEIDEAIGHAKIAAELDASFAPEAEQFIEILKQRKR